MIVDLSYPLRQSMVVWPGEGRPVFEWKARANAEGCNVSYIRMPAHTGTHVDAPLHFLAEGEPLEALPLENFWGKARMFKFGELPAGQEIPLDAVKNGDFSLGDASIFVMQTEIERFTETRDYNLKFPVPSAELLEWLITQGMKTYMTNAPSVDRFAESDECPRHKLLFENSIPIVENLKNLIKLPINTDFTICAMPLLMMGREGSPCRAAAII